jgi:flagellar protein FlaJ
MAKKKTKTKEETSYGAYLETSNIKLSPVVWIAMAFVLAAIIGLLMFFAFPENMTLTIMAIIIIPILLIGLPIILKERRDTNMEEAIPDVFEELATSLRAGATIEQALLDLTKLQKGPLIDELKKALNDMEGGFSFEDSLENLINRVDVVSLKRIFKIVIDGRKAGGELADILDAVASDTRQMARLQRERRSKTVLYVIFIFMAGAVVAPLIFGFITQIAGLVANVGVSGPVANPLVINGLNIFWMYLLIEAFISGVMLAIVRGIRVWKGIVFYSLTMALIGTIVFEVSKIVASAMLPASL